MTEFTKLDAALLGKQHADDGEEPCAEHEWPYATDLYPTYLESYSNQKDNVRLSIVGQRFTVKFQKEALGQWADAFPDAPPGDEVALFVTVALCSRCGKEPTEFGALDPEGITAEGELIGPQICNECLRKGE